ncbi:MAG: ABC transporter ATP-binding protein [Actinomycetota bacterium]|nr:ABC transporter ATP-binding protein [Actinomycetota bacterium]
MAEVSLTGGSFSYGDKQVFEGVNMGVSSGEVFCILGPNGCGKTTLLRCLGGSLRLREGIVHLDKVDLSNMKPEEIARKISFIFQEHETPFPYSVMEIVCMGRAPHLSIFGSPSSRDRKIAEEALGMVGMLHLRDKPYTQISGGERQLVLIARTLAQQPEIIMMDEPTSHLDFKNQIVVLQIINKLAEKGIAIMMTSHYPDHALLFSSQVALMKKGNFLDVGKPADVMTDESLTEVYDMEVSVVSIENSDNGQNLKLCVPKLNEKP